MSHKIRATVFLRKTSTPLANTATDIELYSRERQQRYKCNFNTLRLVLLTKENAILERLKLRTYIFLADESY